MGCQLGIIGVHLPLWLPQSGMGSEKPIYASYASLLLDFSKHRQRAREKRLGRRWDQWPDLVLLPEMFLPQQGQRAGDFNLSCRKPSLVLLIPSKLPSNKSCNKSCSHTWTQQTLFFITQLKERCIWDWGSPAAQVTDVSGNDIPLSNVVLRSPISLVGEEERTI